MAKQMRLLNRILYEHKFDLFKHSIILAYRGSIVHGTYEAKKFDDKDVLGVCVPPIEYIYGLKKFEQFERSPLNNGDPWDVVIYNVRKFVSLLLKSNPNVLSILWLEPNHYISKTEEGQLLIDNRDIFISQKAYYSFTGCAHSQLKRMEKYCFNGYMGQKRKELVDKFGYDPKNASHLIRLLRMGIEYLKTGELQVMRRDASQLLQIKRGEWSLEKIKREAERLNHLADEAFVKCDLPKQPDYDRANDLLVQIISNFYKRT